MILPIRAIFVGAAVVYCQWLLAIASGMVFLFVAGVNAWTWIGGYLGRVRASTAPLIGGVAGAICALSMPIGTINRWWWVPLLVDVGSVPLFVAVAIGVFVRHRRK